MILQCPDGIRRLRNIILPSLYWSIPPACQWNNLSQRGCEGCRQWRCSTDRTSWVQPQPRVNTLEVKEMPAIRQQPQLIGALVICQAYGAACRSGVCLVQLRLRIQKCRIALQSGLIEPYINNTVLRVQLPICRISSPAWLRRLLVSRAKIGGQSDCCDEQQDSNGYTNAIAKSTNVTGAKKSIIPCCAIHILKEY